MMPTQPERPAGVPSEAEWREDTGQWQVVAKTPQGEPEGPSKLWRADGTLLLESHYHRGMLNGPFRRFHRNGQLAREGHYADGAIDGVVVSHAGEGESSEPLRGCCVPSGAVRMEARFSAGALRHETFFDEQGFVLLSNGQRRPERPPNVPESAEFELSGNRWSYGPPLGEAENEGAELLRTWTWWTREGTLSEEADYQAGRRVATRHFDETGEMKESIAYLFQDGHELIPHGTWRRRLSAEETPSWRGPSHVAGAVWLLGHFEHGQSVGLWQLKQGDELVWERDLGVAFLDLGAATRSNLSVFGTAATTDAWMNLADALQQQGRVREALVARARAVATGAPCEVFTHACEAYALPKSPEAAQSQARQLTAAESCTVQDVLEALISGGDAAECLRTLSSQLESWTDAARDIIEASIRLDPARTQSLLTRAFVRLERAEDEGLFADVQQIAAVSEASAAFFHAALQALRPSYAFVPKLMELPALPEPVAMEPAQTLEQVQHVARIYASRLLHVREGLRRFDASERSWSPPSLAHWLPEGPLELRCFNAEIEDEDEEGNPELTVVQINETLSLQNMGVSGLIAQARADWTGLCWLLWAIGQDEVRWPTHVAPRPEYPQALGLAVERAWRARDQVVTSGLRSMSQGLGEFSWEGHALSELPRTLLDVCVGEYLEMRAVLLWYSSAGNLSPFQSDVRQV